MAIGLLAEAADAHANTIAAARPMPRTISRRMRNRLRNQLAPEQQTDVDATPDLGSLSHPSWLSNKERALRRRLRPGYPRFTKTTRNVSTAPIPVVIETKAVMNPKIITTAPALCTDEWCVPDNVSPIPRVRNATQNATTLPPSTFGAVDSDFAIKANATAHVESAKSALTQAEPEVAIFQSIAHAPILRHAKAKRSVCLFSGRIAHAHTSISDF